MKKNIEFIKKIKKYLKDILKTMLFQAITLVILIWAVSFAVSRPDWIPAWESVWWKFINFFINIKWDCSSWQAVYWFNDDLSKKCVDFKMPIWLCWIDLYELAWVCTSVWIWNYSPDNNNTKYACTNKPDSASRNYTYTSDWNGINSCSASYTPKCWIDYYESSNWVCSIVWIWYYSPNLNNIRSSCNNKPLNSSYISDWNWGNNCSFSCDSWYVLDWNSCKIITTTCSLIWFDRNIWGTRIYQDTTSLTNELCMWTCWNIGSNSWATDNSSYCFCWDSSSSYASYYNMYWWDCN